MNEKKDIETLLQEFDLLNPELACIVRSLREIALSIAPDCEEKVMYGGIIYAKPDRMFCGLFLRKSYISIEFDLGFKLTDRDNLLEGSGKYRRHLKIRTEDEIKSKNVEKYIKESYCL